MASTYPTKPLSFSLSLEALARSFFSIARVVGMRCSSKAWCQDVTTAPGSMLATVRPKGPALTDRWHWASVGTERS